MPDHAGIGGKHDVRFPGWYSNVLRGLLVVGGDVPDV